VDAKGLFDDTEDGMRVRGNQPKSEDTAVILYHS